MKCYVTTEPFPRSGHRIVVDDGNLYSIGGYNPDFWEVPNDGDTYYPLFREVSFTQPIMKMIHMKQCKMSQEWLTKSLLVTK